MSSTEENQDLYRELQELRDRVDELENQEKNDSGLPTPSRRGFLTALAGAGAASLSTTPASAQGVSACSFRSHCVLQGSPSDRPDPRPDCKYVYLEGTPDTPNSQVIRYTEDGEWRLFDAVPKNLYGRGYPDHPDYASLTDVLNDVSAAILGPNQYGDINTGDSKTLQGAGFGSKIGNLTAGRDNTVFFLEIEGTSSIGNRNQILAIFALDNDVTITGNLNKYSMGTHLSNTVVVDGDSNTITASSGATTLIPWNVTLNGNDNVVDGNTNVSVTDNGAGNIVGDNT